jgi:hypothetical protein
MSEFDGAETEPDFEDPAYADLRGLLAGAREDAPMPAHVLAKLEATLSGLVAEREDAELDAAEAAQGADVVALRRRSTRSWGPRLLGAAAAVVLIGGVGVGLSRMHGTNEPSADKSAAGSTTAGSTTAGEETPELAAPQVPRAAASTGRVQAQVLTGLGQFTRAGFDRQVAQYLSVAQGLSSSSYATDGLGSVTSGGTASSSGGADQADGGPVPNASVPDGPDALVSEPPADTGLALKNLAALRGTAALRTTAGCPGPRPTDGAVVVRITFAKKPATLVLHPVLEGRQFVTAWSCDGRTLLAATTLSG